MKRKGFQINTLKLRQRSIHFPSEKDTDTWPEVMHLRVLGMYMDSEAKLQFLPNNKTAQSNAEHTPKL